MVELTSDDVVQWVEDRREYGVKWLEYDEEWCECSEDLCQSLLLERES